MYSNTGCCSRILLLTGDALWLIEFSSCSLFLRHAANAQPMAWLRRSPYIIRASTLKHRTASNTVLAYINLLCIPWMQQIRDISIFLWYLHEQCRRRYDHSVGQESRMKSSVWADPPPLSIRNKWHHMVIVSVLLADTECTYILTTEHSADAEVHVILHIQVIHTHSLSLTAKQVIMV